MAVAAEIEQRHQVKTKWIAADFSLGRPIFEKLRQELAGVPVGILGKCKKVLDIFSFLKSASMSFKVIF